MSERISKLNLATLLKLKVYKIEIFGAFFTVVMSIMTFKLSTSLACMHIRVDIAKVFLQNLPKNQFELETMNCDHND